MCKFITTLECKTCGLKAPLPEDLERTLVVSRDGSGIMLTSCPNHDRFAMITGVSADDPFVVAHPELFFNPCVPYCEHCGKRPSTNGPESVASMLTCDECYAGLQSDANADLHY